MAFLLDFAAGVCGMDDEAQDDEIDFCGMPSDQIVEIAIRRDFLLLRLQALVDAETVEDAEVAVRGMEKEAKNEDRFLRFLVRAGTVEIVRGHKLLGGVDETTAETPSKAANSLLKKLMPYHEERRLRELERKNRGNWGRMILSGAG